MEFSKTKLGLNGHGLIEKVIALTGLPENIIRTELELLLSQLGKCTETLTLDQLRDALAAYLEQTREGIQSSAGVQTLEE